MNSLNVAPRKRGLKGGSAPQSAMASGEVANIGPQKRGRKLLPIGRRSAKYLNQRAVEDRTFNLLIKSFLKGIDCIGFKRLCAALPESEARTR